MNALEQKLEEMRSSDYAEQNKTIQEAVSDVTDGFSLDELADYVTNHIYFGNGMYIRDWLVENIINHEIELERLKTDRRYQNDRITDGSVHEETVYETEEQNQEDIKTLKSERQDDTRQMEIRQSNNLTKTRQQLTEMFLEILQSDDPLRWKRGWNGGSSINAVTGNTYKGINCFALDLKALVNGYQDYRWCTFKQASDAGWKIKRGSKGTPVEFWSFYDKVTKTTINSGEYYKLIKENPEYRKNIRIIAREYTVFNGDQIEGIPELEKRPITRPEELETFLNTLQKEMDIQIIHGGSKAFYSPASDEIHVPDPDRFNGIYEYYSTTFHEAGHATGAEKRLNRDLTGTFGSEKYAREELRAEIASCFISNDLGIPNGSEEHDKNHAAYIQSWIQVIKDAPGELMKAIKDAEKIADYIEEKGNIAALKLSMEKGEKIESNPSEEKTEKAAEPDKSQAEAIKRNNLMRLRMGASR